MKNYHLLSIFITLVSSISARASIITDEFLSNELISYPSVWIGGNIGVSSLDYQINKVNNHHISPSFKADVGYDFNKYIGIYSSYGFVDSVADLGSINIFSAGILGRYEVFKHWSVFGKIGIGYFNGMNESYNATGSGGVGVEYTITPSISTKFEYNYYQDVDMNQSNTQLSQILWGLSYRFGQPSIPVIKENRTEVVIENKNTTLSRNNYLISFPIGISSLDEWDTFTLTELVFAMHRFPYLKAEVIGRTDSTGSTATNEKLSENRAISVKNYLLSHGINLDRLIVSWVANNDPLDTSSSKNSELERSVQVILK